MPAAGKRSEERKAEVKVMDRIEGALAAIDDLPERAQARVRSWVLDEYATPWEELAAGNGRPAAGDP